MGIDFVVPIDPPAYKTQAQYIIVATNYLTKWVEARATRHNDAQTIAKFLYEEIFMRYELPIELVNDHGTRFLDDVIATLLDKFLVIHNVSAPYHPQANEQVESTNKTLCTIITMLLQSSLWAYCVALKSFNGNHTFQFCLWHECYLAHGIFDTYSTNSYKS